jgi:hypothetical protein
LQVSIGEILEARLMGEPSGTQYPVQPRLDPAAAMADVELEPGADLVMLIPNIAAEAVSQEEDGGDAADKVLAAWMAHYKRKPPDARESEDISAASTESDKGSGKGSANRSGDGQRSLQPSPVLEQPALPKVTQKQSDMMMPSEGPAPPKVPHPKAADLPLTRGETGARSETAERTPDFSRTSDKVGPGVSEKAGPAPVTLAAADVSGKQKRGRDDEGVVGRSDAAQAAVPPQRPALGDSVALAQSDLLMEADNMQPMPERPRLSTVGDARHAQADLLMGPDLPPAVDGLEKKEFVPEKPKASKEDRKGAEVDTETSKAKALVAAQVPEQPSLKKSSGEAQAELDFATSDSTAPPSGAGQPVAPVQPQMKRAADAAQAEQVMGAEMRGPGASDGPPRPQRPRMDDGGVRAQDDML